MRIGLPTGVIVATLLTVGRAGAQTRDSPGEVPGVDRGPETSPLPVPVELLQVQGGGLTADRVALRASTGSWTGQAAARALESAIARARAAWESFLPRFSQTVRYTRLSTFTPPPIVLGPGTPPVPGFPIIADNTLLQATLNIAISDDLFRMGDTVKSAERSRDAANSDLSAARATAAMNGRLAYYAWLSARGAVIVATETVNDLRAHLRTARGQFSAGNASKADVLRAETAVALAEVALQRTVDAADVAEILLRTALHAGDDEVLEPGESLDAAEPPVIGSAARFTTEALSARPEVRSVDANIEALRLQASAAEVSRWPSISLFADAIEGNPNPRYFPSGNVWFGTWDVGCQATWAINDVLATDATVEDLQSRAGALYAQGRALREGIRTEVAQTLKAVTESDYAVAAYGRALASAIESYRVASELFANAGVTSTTLEDAEAALAQARLDLLTARVAARTTRVRFEHALGRDGHPQSR